MLHKLFVMGCFGVTVGGIAYSGGLIYYHYKVVLPARTLLEETATALQTAAASPEFDHDDGSSSNAVLQA